MKELKKNMSEKNYSPKSNLIENMHKISPEIDTNQKEKKIVEIMPCAEIIKPGPSSTNEKKSLDEDHAALEYIPKLENCCNDCSNGSMHRPCDKTTKNCALRKEPKNLLDYRCIRRSRKKNSNNQSCPSCGITLHSSTVSKHFSEEIERLQKWHMDLKKKRTYMRTTKTEMLSSELKNLKETAKEIVHHRRNRIIAQYELLKPWMNIKCPNCRLPLMEPNDFLHHNEICNSIQEDSADLSSNETAENISGLEEAVRFAHASSRSVIHLTRTEEETENVDIEIQVEEEFGSQQYFTDDLIPTNTEDTQGNKLNEESNDEKAKESSFTEEKDEKDIVIDSLRMKIYELQKKKHREVLCAVCMGSYEVPLVSVICWHVLCEKCWLTTLKASSLCPLCKVITNVLHLRRVYI